MIRFPSKERLGALLFVLIVFLSTLGSPAAAATAADPTPVVGSPAGSSVNQSDDSGSNETEISPAVAVRLAQSREEGETNEAGSELVADTIPVIVVLRHQPGEVLERGNLSMESRRQQTTQFVREHQKNVTAYLNRQHNRGHAADIKTFRTRNVVAVEATPETIHGLARIPEVERIIYDQLVVASSAASPFAAILERLREHGNVSVAPQGVGVASSGDRAWNVEYVGADEVHKRGITGDGVNVSVIDTGIDADHPALSGQVIRWKDFSGSCSTPCDPNGHGTHVAGTIAGRQDAKLAVGIAPGANLFGVRVFDKYGLADVSDILAAFEWSANRSADVVSASFGLPPLTDTHAGSRSVSTNSSSGAEFPVYANATAGLDGGAASLSNATDGFKPSYVYVIVEPTDENGTDISEDADSQSRVMRNLSVALEDPDGDRPLTRTDAGWVFVDGSVPDSIGFWRFTPNASAPVRNGSWMLRVNSSHDENVSYSFRVVPVYPTNGSDEMSRFVDALATTWDVTPVIAAGNSGVLRNRSLASPGAAKEAITVGAAGFETDDVAGFSSRGPVGFGNDTRPGVDLIAPGVDVVSTYPAALVSSGDYDDAYVNLSGTSMATPHVSGVVALLLDANASLSRGEIRSTLRSSARDVPYGQNVAGAGALDAWAAVNTTNIRPSVWNATAVDEDGDGRVTGGDTITIRANATDFESAVNVTANASAFGAGTVRLTHVTGSLFNATVTVDAANASTNGSYTTLVTAYDGSGNANTATTNELQLNTSISGPKVGTLSAGDVTVAPGETVTVAFNATNVGESDRSFIVRLSAVPENFTMSDRFGDGGTWNGDDSWLYQTITPAESRHPSVTFTVPTNASGEYVVDAELLTSETTADTTRATISTTVSLQAAIDADDNGRIGDFEILEAITLWRDAKTVPGTGGKTISDTEILELIELWRDGAAVG